MQHPFVEIADVAVVLRRAAEGERSQRARPKALSLDPETARVLGYRQTDAFRAERAGAARVVADWPEEWRAAVLAVAGGMEISYDRASYELA